MDVFGYGLPLPLLLPFLTLAHCLLVLSTKLTALKHLFDVGFCGTAQCTHYLLYLNLEGELQPLLRSEQYIGLLGVRLSLELY